MSFWKQQTEPIDQSLPDQELPPGLQWSISAKDNELLQFYRQNYTITPVTITLLTQEHLDWIRQDCLQVVMTDDQGIIGSCFCIMFETSIGKLAHTIFLCVRSEKTQKGIAPILIRQLMILGSRCSPPIRVGYHEVHKPIGNNSLPLQGWAYPLNLKHCQRLGFIRPTSGKHVDRKAKYVLPSVPTDKYQLVSDQVERFTSWLTMESKAKIHLTDYTRLLSHPEVHLTVIMAQGIPITGILWRNNRIHFRNIGDRIIPSIQMVIGQLNIEIFSLFASQIIGSLIYLNELGSVTQSFLNEIHAVSCGIRYINWYNYSDTLSKGDFYLPLL